MIRYSCSQQANVCEFEWICRFPTDKFFFSMLCNGLLKKNNSKSTVGISYRLHHDTNEDMFDINKRQSRKINTRFNGAHDLMAPTT